MARETKVGLLVGLGVILLVGIIVSDHLSVVQKQASPNLTGFAPAALNSVNQEQLPAAPGPAALPAAPTALPASLPQTVSAPPTPAPVSPIPAPDEMAAPGGVSPLPPIQRAADIELPATAANTSKTYTVKSGDTLYSIAAKNLGSSNKWKDLMAANKTALKRPQDLRIGMKLSLPMPPAVAQAPVVPTGAPAPTPANVRLPVAAPNSVTVARGNDGFLTPNVPLAVDHGGAVALAPVASDPAKSSYTVAKGDTLGSIAAKTLGSSAKWKDLMAANKSTLKRPEDLKPGQVINVPALASRR